MPVVGCHAYIMSNTGRKADVNAFSPDFEPMTIPIVDAAVQYNCKFTGKSYLLIIHNALHVPSMENNLIPPFLMRETGISVDDTPKILLENDFYHFLKYERKITVKIFLKKYITEVQRQLE